MKKTLAKKTKGGRKEGVLHISTVKALNASSFLSDILMQIFGFFCSCGIYGQRHKASLLLMLLL